jgi:hypothetical protein
VLLLHCDERLDFDLESLGNSDEVSELLRKLGSVAPNSYAWSLTYAEKVDMLLLLVDFVHDLDSFRQFLNSRIEDRSVYFK